MPATAFHRPERACKKCRRDGIDPCPHAWYIRYNSRGKRKARHVAGGEAAARKLEAAFNRDEKKLASVTRAPGGPKAFDAVAAAYWDAKCARLADTTQLSRRTVVFGRLVPRIGTRDIRKLDDKALEALGLELCHLSPKTVAFTGSVLTIILRWAAKEKLIEALPYETTPRQIFREIAKAHCRPVARERDAWSPEEADVLSAAAAAHGPWIGDAVLFARHTGCRISELVALEWGDVDMKRGRVTFRQARPLKKNKGTKSGKSRTIRASQPVLEMLRQRAAHPRKHATSVFLNSKHRPWLAQSIDWIWDVIREECPDVRPLTWHCWRHTWASWALDAGWPPRAAAKYIGDTPKVFFENYVHILPDGDLPLDFLNSAPSAARPAAPPAPPARAAHRGLRLVREG